MFDQQKILLIKFNVRRQIETKISWSNPAKQNCVINGKQQIPKAPYKTIIYSITIERAQSFH